MEINAREKDEKPCQTQTRTNNLYAGWLKKALTTEGGSIARWFPAFRVIAFGSQNVQVGSGGCPPGLLRSPPEGVSNVHATH